MKALFVSNFYFFKPFEGWKSGCVLGTLVRDVLASENKELHNFMLLLINYGKLSVHEKVIKKRDERKLPV